MFTIVFKGTGFSMTDTYTSYAELLARLNRVDWTSWNIEDIEVWAVRLQIQEILDDRQMNARRMTLLYSPDDNGWYWQRYSDWKTSQLFALTTEAIKAFEGGLLVWED